MGRQRRALYHLTSGILLSPERHVYQEHQFAVHRGERPALCLKTQNQVMVKKSKRKLGTLIIIFTSSFRCQRRSRGFRQPNCCWKHSARLLFVRQIASCLSRQKVPTRMQGSQHISESPSLGHIIVSGRRHGLLQILNSTMGKKNTIEPKSSKHRSLKSTGKPSGRGFTGHRGRGGRRTFEDYDFPDPVEDEKFSENAENEECGESNESSDGLCLPFILLQTNSWELSRVRIEYNN
jgi:hypothetical protein